MLKLMKYELRKKLVPYLILFVVTAIVEIFAVYSIMSKSNEKVAISVILFSLIGSFSMFYVFILAVDSYSKEISSKYSFMTFMTPNSSYSIVGSKLLTTFLVAVAFTAFFCGCFALDVKLFLSEYNEAKSFYDFMDDIFGEVGIDLSGIIVSMLVMVLSIWVSLVSIICFAYTSVTLSYTALANKKGRKIASILIFVAFFIINYIIDDKIPTFDYGSSFILEVAGNWISYLYSIVVMIICFITSGYLLDKKVSL